MTGRPPPALDLRLAWPAGCAWVAAVACPAVPAPSRWWLLGLAAAVAVAAALGRRTVLAAAALGALVGGAAVALHLAALRTGPVAALAGERRTVELTVRLVRDPMPVTAGTGRRMTVADATVSAVRTDDRSPWQRDRAPVVVFAPGSSWAGLLPGQRLTVTGKLAPPRAGDDVAAVVFAGAGPQLRGRPPPWQRWAARVRDGLRTACDGLSADARGLVPGLVIGDIAAMPPELTDAFRVTGLAHLNAVSGANVAIVLGAVVAAVRRTGIGRVGRTLLAGLALAGFVVLVRPSPSVLRASVMGAVVLVAVLLGRRSSPMPVLAAAVLALVVLDPPLARSPGFTMSVLATAAIVVVSPRWTDRLARVLPRPLAAAVAVPAAAQLACTPVLVAVFGQLTPYAVVANLLAAPAVAPATLLGISCALVAVAAPPVAALLAHLAGLPAGWLAVVARTFAAAPGAGLRWPGGSRGVLLLPPALAAAWLAVRTARQWRRAVARS